MKKMKKLTIWNEWKWIKWMALNISSIGSFKLDECLFGGIVCLFYPWFKIKHFGDDHFEYLFNINRLRRTAVNQRSVHLFGKFPSLTRDVRFVNVLQFLEQIEFCPDQKRDEYLDIWDNIAITISTESITTCYNTLWPHHVLTAHSNNEYGFHLKFVFGVVLNATKSDQIWMRNSVVSTLEMERESDWRAIL